jgi:ubiquinone/menaquinone biosynthesis C-methylase UbiE
MDASEKFWNKIAGRYAKRPIADLEAYHAKLEATKACLKPDDVILDVGCGTGSLALELSACVSEVHAIDLSREMINIAKRKAVDQDIDNVAFYKTTLANAPFGAETFNAVCAYNILHLLDDRRTALSVILDLLKPGGLLISSTPCLGESRMPFRFVLPIMKLLGKAPAVRVFDIRQLKSNLIDVGFVNVTEKKVSSDKINGFLIAMKPG